MRQMQLGPTAFLYWPALDQVGEERRRRKKKEGQKNKAYLHQRANHVGGIGRMYSK